MVIKHHTNLRKYKKEIMIIIILYKISQEYIMHHNLNIILKFIDKCINAIKEYL